MSDPALRCFLLAGLDAGKGIIELTDDLAGLIHAGRKIDDLITVYDAANRGDDCCSTAKAALLEALNFENFTGLSSTLRCR